MSESIRNLPATTATDRPDAAAPGAGPHDATPRFRELLERLQKIATEQQAVLRDADGPVEDPERLQAALRTADDGFATAMDLRQKLEAAFRRHLP